MWVTLLPTRDCRGSKVTRSTADYLPYRLSAEPHQRMHDTLLTLHSGQVLALTGCVKHVIV